MRALSGSTPQGVQHPLRVLQNPAGDATADKLAQVGARRFWITLRRHLSERQPASTTLASIAYRVELYTYPTPTRPSDE